MNYQEHVLQDADLDIPHAFPLRFDTDVSQIALEVAALEADWLRQVATTASGPRASDDPRWTVVPLRSSEGRTDRADPGGAGHPEYEDTPYMRATPSVARLLDQLPGTPASVRIMQLSPGGRIREHVDSGFGLEHGRIRLHLPLTTNPSAYITFAGTDVHMSIGSLWFGNFKVRHWARNEGATTRVHLVVDLDIDDGISALLPEAAKQAVDGLMTTRPGLRERSGTARHVEFRLFKGWVYGAEDLFAADDWVSASLTDDGSTVRLQVGEDTLTELIAVGRDEYRFSGWNMERTLMIVTDEQSGDHVRHLVRKGRREYRRDGQVLYPRTAQAQVGRA